MTTEATSFLGHEERAGTANHAFAGRNLLRQSRRFIESTDWDVITPVRQCLLDRVCIALLAAVTLYFLPILVQVCLR